ncbi:Cytochrome c6, chloroplastic [Olea europaea subsp. europaea]|uniref:O-fucosyltransferase family protein n=1 Tax=Olea europaea subsp. europaea TaxID=158383 RepID=A0A8S0RF43_OLEEU|nr:Cytochrome c6, chloroplastic [Olea europaea subsp. europaea]
MVVSGGMNQQRNQIVDAVVIERTIGAALVMPILQVSVIWGDETKDGVLLLRGLDSRLSEDLPSDLQKLRCKLASHALRFAPHISEFGNKLIEDEN